MEAPLSRARRTSATPLVVWLLLAVATLMTLRGHLVLVAAVAVAALCVWAAVRSAETAVVALFLTELLPQILNMTPWTVSGGWPVSFAGVRPTDLVLLAMIGAALLRLAAPRTMARQPGIGLPADLLIFSGLFAVCLLAAALRNWNAYGVSSVAELRYQYGFLIVPMYLAITARTQDCQRRLLVIFIWLSVFAPLVLLPLIGTTKGWSLGATSRFYHSGVSLAILLGTSALLLARRRGLVSMPAPLVALAVAFATTEIVVDGHRSVWLAAAGLFVMLVLLGEIPVARFWHWGSVALVLLLAGLVAAYALGFNVVTYVSERAVAFSNPSSDPTSSWRLTQWKYYLAEVRRQPLFGEGFGAYFSLYIPEYGYAITVSPHDFYILTAIKSGLVGLAAYAGTVFAAARVLRQRVRCGDDALSGLTTFLVAFGVVVIVVVSLYLVVYASTWFGVLWIGLGLGACASRSVPPESHMTSPRKSP